MVGGLVEQQKVGRLEQQPAKPDPPALTARELRHVGIRRRQAQRIHRQRQAGVEIPGIGGFDPVLDARVLLEYLLHLVRGQVLTKLDVQLVITRQQGLDRCNPLFDVAEHRLGRFEPGLLMEKPDRDAGGRKRLAQKALILARHDAKERALACTVQAEHANLRAIIETKRDIAQDLFIRHALRKASHTVHGVDDLSIRGHSGLILP